MLELKAGPLSARIHPEIGGIIAGLEWRGPDGRLHPLLRAPPGLAPSTAAPNKMGSWAMVPFANCAFDRIICDGEQRFALPDNRLGGGHCIHGFGWESDWVVLGHSAGHTVLEHRREAGPDPYRYRVSQTIALDEAGLTVNLALTNEADQALPYGLGHHPWFPAAPDTRLRMAARGALLFGGEGYRATGSRDLDAGGPYAEGAVFATGEEVAWSFLGWDGTARIETPSTGLAITLTASESLRCPVVWAPPGADFLCVEPQSHAIGSPSERAAREAAPLTRLAPGETLQGWLRIVPAAL